MIREALPEKLTSKESLEGGDSVSHPVTWEKKVSGQREHLSKDPEARVPGLSNKCQGSQSVCREVSKRDRVRESVAGQVTWGLRPLEGLESFLGKQWRTIGAFKLDFGISQKHSACGGRCTELGVGLRLESLLPSRNVEPRQGAHQQNVITGQLYNTVY